MNAKQEIRLHALTGSLGSGYVQETLDTAMEWGAHVIGADAGSTDPGPRPLGSGHPAFARDAVKRDLRPAIKAALEHRIPLLVGSAGTAGSDVTLEWAAEIIREIAHEDGHHFKLALIHSEQEPELLKTRLREGRIRPLDPAPPIDEALFDRSTHIVGMMGAEPYMAALDNGADVVLAGRSSDTSIYAAVPMLKGADAGLTWHAAKILECAAAAVVRRTRTDGLFGRIRPDHFIIEPPNPEYACSPLSVAAQTLHETANPFFIREPAGTLVTTEATYEPISDRAVRVTGSRFEKADEYTIKLEGAEMVGYQAILPGGIRDPYVINRIDEWIERLREKVLERVLETYGSDLGPQDFDYRVRLYGKNGVLGASEPHAAEPGHEIGLILEATAPTQEIANTIVSAARHIGLHLPVPEWKGIITAIAFPYGSSPIERGAVYNFNLHHTVVPNDPLEMFPIEYEQV